MSAYFPGRRKGGFTLLEVMIALLVITLGMGAVIVTTGESAWKSSHLRESTIASWVPLAVFGGASLLASLVIVVLMPETLGRPLTETIEDFERAASEDHQSGGRRPGRDGRSRGGPRRETADASENATLAQEVL